MSNSAKEIVFEKTRTKLAKGISTLASAVAQTLGPKGHNVGLDKSWGAPTVTNDGGTIVKDISLEDDFEDMGASLAKEAVQQVKELCGDGTTTTMTLINALVSLGIRQITAGSSPIQLKRGMDKMAETIVAQLKKQAIPVKDQSQILHIATAAASGNQTIGKNIAQAMEKAGPGHVVMIQEAKGTSTVIESIEGLEFDRGYLSPYFCTNNEKLLVEMEQPSFLILDKKVSNIHELLPVLQAVAATNKKLVIIAEDVDGDALSTLIFNKLRGILQVAVVKSPGFGDRRKALLEDIAIATGSKVVSDEVSQEASAECLGSAEKVVIHKDRTLIIKGHGAQELIDKRLRQIEREISEAKGYDKEKLEERKAKLSGSVAVIFVGAPTEMQLKQEKQIYEDSLNSTRAALDSGIVTGGGIGLLRAALAAQPTLADNEERIGAQIVAQACQAPVRQIVENSHGDGSVIIAELLKATGHMGFNALSGKIEDLLQAGIMDPAKIVESCLTFAVSAAGTIWLSEVLITDAKEESANA